MGNMAHNTDVSKLAFGPWRVPPADRNNSEVRTYYLTPEELEKYKGGQGKMEEKNSYQTKNKELKEILRKDLETKTIEQIATEQNVSTKSLKIMATKAGIPWKKEETSVVKADKGISLKAVTFGGKFSYRFNQGKLSVKQDKRHMIIIELNDIADLITEIADVKNRIKLVREGKKDA